jgi:hypothetical protein
MHDDRSWHFSDITRCLILVRKALKSGRASNANGRTKSSVGHSSPQPIIIGRRAPRILKSLLGNLRELRRPDGTHSKETTGMA